MVIEPRRIDPGWAKRWTKQSFDLFRRGPLLILANVLIFLATASVFSVNSNLVAFTSIFTFAFLFSSLRALDRDSGNHWSTTYHYFRQTVWDLFKLSAIVFVLLFISQFVLHHFPVYVVSGTTHPTSVENLTLQHYNELPFWLRNCANVGLSSLTLGLFCPGVVQLIFLTMALGSAPIQHFRAGYHGAIINHPVVYRMLAPGFIFCFFWDTVLQTYPSHLLGYVTVGILALAYAWFGSWGYLWCREMFEGTKENQTETVSNKEKIVIPSTT